MTKEEVEQAFYSVSPYYAYKQGLQDGAAYNEESFRREAAKDILCAVLAGGIANGANGFDAQKEEIVNASIGVADELIKQLREEKK